MIQLDQLAEIVGNTLLAGNASLAGVLIFIGVIALAFTFTRSVFLSLLLMLPTSFFFGELGVISSDLMLLLILISVLGLAVTAKGQMTRSD